ncbi:MAG TPA: hypothetical protein VL995_09670 [Cellvibrio sp.]|nr:hypothetical protein [Cellvibrio sp.]
MSIKEMRLEKLEREEHQVRQLSILVKYLCLSLCCKYHYASNGNLFDFNEIRMIYAAESVPDDCNCGITQVVVNELGLPLYPKNIEKVRAQKSRFQQ